MTTNPQSQDTIDWEVDKNKLPGSLNTLSILSFIGCGLGLIGMLIGILRKTPSEADLQEMQDKFDRSPEFLKSIMGSHSVELTRKTIENSFSMNLLGFISIALCLYGVLRMRALKKEGFYIYVIGELVLPLASMIIFTGLGLYGSITLAFAILIPLLFVILYATQLKYLS